MAKNTTIQPKLELKYILEANPQDLKPSWTALHAKKWTGAGIDSTGPGGKEEGRRVKPSESAPPRSQRFTSRSPLRTAEMGQLDLFRGVGGRSGDSMKRPNITMLGRVGK